MFPTTVSKAALLVSILSIGTSASPTLDKKSAESEVEHGLEKRATYTGTRATYYDTSVGLGSCGILHQNNEYTVAMNSAQMSDSACGQTITITYNGKTTQAGVWDTCPTCPYGGLDLSEGLFSFFASQDAGVIYVDWSWGSSNSDPTTSTSHYVAPTTTSTSYTPTSTYTPPTTSSTYVAPTTTSTYETPSTTSTTPTSTYVAPTSSSTSAEPSSSSSSSLAQITSSTTASSFLSSNGTASTSTGSTITALTTIDDPFVTSTATLSAASASQTGTSTTGTESGSNSGGNLLLLGEMIVNLGRVVVISGGAS